MMADDDLLDDDFDYEDYDITNEKEEALLQDDEDYSKSRDSYDDKKGASSQDEDEEDILNLDIEEDFQDVDGKALCEEKTHEEKQPKFATTDKSQNSKTPVKTSVSAEEAPANKRVMPAAKKTNNAQQKFNQNKRVAHQNDKWKRGNGRGGNFQNRSNFVKNNTQRRRNGTVFVNPRYEGTVHINENSARLAWDNDPQNHQNNLNFVPPWVSQNTQDQMLISNLVTEIASNFAVPNLLLPQVQPLPQNFYQPTQNNYERQLSFEPPPNIDVQPSQPLYHQNQVSSQQMYPSSQPHPSTLQPYLSRGTSQEFNNQLPTGRMNAENNSFNSYSNPNHYDRPNNQRNYSLQYKKNSYGNENYNYNRPNTRPTPYNNNKNNSRPTTLNNNYSLQSGNTQNKSTHYPNNGGSQNKNPNYGSNISKQQEGYNNFNTNYYAQNNLNRNENKQGNENTGVNYNTNFKQNENPNTFNNDFNRPRQQNQDEFSRQNNVQKNTPYVANKNFNERRNRRPAFNENSDNRNLLGDNKPKMTENIKGETKKAETDCKTQPAQNFPVKQEVEEEDEETRLYRIKIEEQKKEREKILRMKEERRKQMLLEQKKQDEVKLLNAESGKPTQLPIPNKNYSDKSNNFPKANFVEYPGPQRPNQYPGPQRPDQYQGPQRSDQYPGPGSLQQSVMRSGSSNSDLAVELPQFTFKVSNVPQENAPITKDVPKNDVSSGGGFMSNRVVLVKSKNKPKTGILPNSNLIKIEPNVESSDVGQGNSSFFNNRKVLKKDNDLLNTRLVVVNNLSATINQNKLMALARGIGEIQTLRVDKQERQATILFRSVASAHAFYKKYQRRILDDLSVIEVNLEPMI